MTEAELAAARELADRIEQRCSEAAEHGQPVPADPIKAARTIRTLVAEVERGAALLALMRAAEERGYGLHMWPHTAEGDGPNGEWKGKASVTVDPPGEPFDDCRDYLGPILHDAVLAALKDLGAEG